MNHIVENNKKKEIKNPLNDGSENGADSADSGTDNEIKNKYDDDD